jgi:hypothetical protein
MRTRAVPRRPIHLRSDVLGSMVLCFVLVASWIGWLLFSGCPMAGCCVDLGKKCSLDGSGSVGRSCWSREGVLQRCVKQIYRVRWESVRLEDCARPAFRSRFRAKHVVPAYPGSSTLGNLRTGWGKFACSSSGAISHEDRTYTIGERWVGLTSPSSPTTSSSIRSRCRCCRS